SGVASGATTKVLKVDLAAFDSGTWLQINNTNDSLKSAVIDVDNQHAFFGTTTMPAKVIELDLSNFSVESSIPFSGDSSGLNAGQLTAWTPSGPVGWQSVTVTNPDGQCGTLDNAFEYKILPPVISSVAPLSGPAAGGTPIIIIGNNFSPDDHITIEGIDVLN